MTGFDYMKREFIIEIKNVSKLYKSPVDSKKKFYAIKNFNLKVKKGEKIGLMGDNGAGKTTLLKLIAGIIVPDRGLIKTFGKVVSVVNLEAGFSEDLTGEENIVLNGMIYGMSKEEISLAKSRIIEFADIGEFIYAPFYTYSSGMRFRLALAVALATNPDIIIMDEVFLAGDINFQIRTLEKIEEMVSRNEVTLIMASHHPLILRKYCNRFVFIKNGEMFDSTLESVLRLTKRWNDFFLDVDQVGIEKKMLKDPFYQR
jgi:ABC-type polysaccharide/polyol phosphate transport system ATPase subunit